MTRAEYLSILSRVLDYEKIDYLSKENYHIKYTDLDTNYWACNDILNMLEVGLLDEYNNEKLYPDNFISNQELYYLTCRCINLNLFPKGTPLGDLNKNEATELVYTTFDINSNSNHIYLNRSILIRIINDFLYYDKEPIMDNYFYDVNTDNKFYKDILRSTAFDVENVNPK